MISGGRHLLLNSSTTTVSSLSLLSSCLFSSSSSPTTTTRHHRNSSSSFSSSIPSLHSSFLLVLAAAVFSCLMCQEVSASPSPRPHPRWIPWKYSENYGKRFENKNSTNVKHSLLDDMTQNDEPPRDLYQSVTVPKSWIKQPQDRIYYLRAENDQYLQFHDGKITGTKESKPPFGIVRFLSHKENVVIRSFVDDKYLCMNEGSVLYLSNKGDDPECFIEELSLQNNGSYATAYRFSKYKTEKRRYLGINCDPILGTEADPSMRSSRFARIDINQKEADAVKDDIKKGNLETYVKKKCISLSEKKHAAKAKRRKLRLRWCLNLDRMVQNRRKYVLQCKKRESQTNCDRSDSKRCVCNILINMLHKPKRAKRKCLVEKLTKWIKNKSATLNKDAAIEASKLLVRNYAAITRRMRILRARKTRKRQREFKKSQLLTETRQEVHHISPGPSSVKPTQDLETITPMHHEGSGRRRRRKRRRRIIKLNSLLKIYGHELILSTPSVSLGEESATMETTTPAGHASQKIKEPSALSKEFKDALNSLSSEPRRLHKQHRRRRKKRKHRMVHKESQIHGFSSGDDNSRQSGGISPG